MTPFPLAMKPSNSLPIGDRSFPSVALSSERLAMTYRMDALVPGLYGWAGRWTFRLGGSDAEENYSGMIHQSVGCAIVLPGYRIFSPYPGSYDPR